LASSNLMQAAELLNQAVKRDPAFLLAWCELASVQDRLYFLGFDHTPERLAAGEAAIQTAQRLNPDAGETHLAVAQHRYRGYRDYNGARAEIAIAQRTLPNDPLPFELLAYIDRRQGRWNESIRNFERAIELDPRNFYTLQQMALGYQTLRRYADEVRVLDRALTIVPNNVDTKVARALVELNWHADTRPLHNTIETVLADNPALAPSLGDTWLILALCERDLPAASRAVAALGNNPISSDAILLSPALVQGLVAKVQGDAAAARTLFSKARTEQEERSGPSRTMLPPYVSSD
jgi:serine/threonine-protein kinase